MPVEFISATHMLPLVRAELAAAPAAVPAGAADGR
jgi:hypothetical protein